MFFRKLSPSLQFALFFWLCGMVWILFTDPFIKTLASDNLIILARIQTYKGVLFMFLAATAIYFVSKGLVNKVNPVKETLALQHEDCREEIAREVVKAQEVERQKLSLELHDNVNQLLGVIKLYIEHAQLNPAAKDDMLKKSSEYLVQAIDEIRMISKSLVSPAFSGSGLIQSIKDIIQSILQIQEIRISFRDHAFEEERLSTDKQLMLYRILQEHLNNVLKHARAGQVDVELKRTGNHVNLTIQDDGVGFDPDGRYSGLGLKNIANRIRLLKGTMNINSAPGKGCRLHVSFPL